jgi:hypothetical protein
MFSFLFNTISKRDEDIKIALKKELFNSKHHKKVVTRAAKESAEDQQKILLQYHQRARVN